MRFHIVALLLTPIFIVCYSLSFERPVSATSESVGFQVESDSLPNDSLIQFIPHEKLSHLITAGNSLQHRKWGRRQCEEKQQRTKRRWSIIIWCPKRTSWRMHTGKKTLPYFSWAVVLLRYQDQSRISFRVWRKDRAYTVRICSIFLIALPSVLQSKPEMSLTHSI